MNLKNLKFIFLKFSSGTPALVPSIFTRSAETAPVLNIACATERHS